MSLIMTLKAAFKLLRINLVINHKQTERKKTNPKTIIIPFSPVFEKKENKIESFLSQKRGEQS